MKPRKPPPAVDLNRAIARHQTSFGNVAADILSALMARNRDRAVREVDSLRGLYRHSGVNAAALDRVAASVQQSRWGEAIAELEAASFGRDPGSVAAVYKATMELAR